MGLLAAIEPGITAGDALSLGLAMAGVALLIAVVALSHEPDRAFSASAVYLLVGIGGSVLLGVLDIGRLDPVDDASLIEHLCELAAVIAIFSGGLSVQRRLDAGATRSVVVLLLVVLPLTVGVIALLGTGWLGLSLGAAIALGASISPTDPVLAGDVGVGPPGEDDDAHAQVVLHAEASVNDGIAAPFVILGVLVAAEGGTGFLGAWVLEDLVLKTVGGVVAGVVFGQGLAALLHALRGRDWVHQRFEAFAAPAIALVTYGGTQWLGLYGFVAVFFAGLAVRRYERGHVDDKRVHEGADVVDTLLELTVLLVLGSMFTTEALGIPGWEGWGLAIAVVVLRPLIALPLLPRGTMERDERRFAALFGVRGVAALYYGAVVAGAGVFSREEAETVFWTGAACVIVSIVVHGFGATPLMRRMLPEPVKEQ